MATNPPLIPGSSVPPKRTRWPLYVGVGLLAFILLVVATVAITLWWIQRPIKPVVLTPPEKSVLEQKLQRASGETPSTVPKVPAVPDRGSEMVEMPNAFPAPTNLNQPPARTYVPGSKVLKITEREINGLLNANTDLGKSVRLEFSQDAVNAYLVVPIPQDFPIMGGKMFRARGRFRVSLGNGGAPYAILEDVTVFGLSLPKAWLGGLKGENLLGDALGEGKRGPVLRGIKALRVEPGALVLEVED